MMNGISMLVTALEQAAGRHAASEKKLAAARVAAGEARGTLDTLVRYRDDYTARWRKVRLSDAAALHNLRRFVAKLDEAVSAQQQQFQRCETAVHEALGMWNETRRRVRALELLIQQRQRAAALRDKRQEQKRSDEFAARRGSKYN